MDAEYFRTLWDYSYWARDRLLRAMEGMSEEEYARPNGFVYGSIQGILGHTLWAEAGWLALWKGEAERMPPPSPPPPLAELPARWAEVEAAMRAYLAGLSDADVRRERQLKRRDGSMAVFPLGSSWRTWPTTARSTAARRRRR